MTSVQINKIVNHDFEEFIIWSVLHLKQLRNSKTYFDSLVWVVSTLNLCMPFMVSVWNAGDGKTIS